MSNEKYEVGDYFLYLETGREARVIDVIDTDDYSGEFLDLEKPKWCRCSSTTMQPIATSLTPVKGETMVAADAIEEPIYTPATAPASLPDAPAGPAVEPAVAVEVVPSTSKFKSGDEVFAPCVVDGMETFVLAAVLEPRSSMYVHVEYAAPTADGITDDWFPDDDLRFAEPVQDDQGAADAPVAADAAVATDAPAASEALVGVPSLTVEEIITRHLNLLFKPNDRLCITLIHRTRLNSSETSALTINNLMTIEEALAPEKLKWMQEKNNEGFNVYSTMTALIPGADKRRKELTKNEYCRSVFAEVDEGGCQVYGDIVDAAEANDIPWPSIILQSSPNKFQFIWRVAGDDLSIEKIERLNEAIVQKFKCDPASTDILRLFRIPGLRNVKVEYMEKPIVEVVSVAADRRYSLDEFKLLVGEKIVTPAKPAADEEQLSKIRDYFEAAAAEVDAKIDAEPTDPDGTPRQKLNISVLKKWDDKGYLWNMNCFWRHLHDKEKDLGTTAVELHTSGALSFTCHHGHCKGVRSWQKDMRPKMEEIVGHSLPFGDPGPVPAIGGLSIRAYGIDPAVAPAQTPTGTNEPTPSPASVPELPSQPVGSPSPTPVAPPKLAIGGHRGISVWGKSRMPDPLGQDAYYGLAGRHLRNIEHRSEAHPAGMLGCFLSAFGSMVGTNAFVRIEDNLHYPIVNVLVTGRSGRSRKDTAIGRALRPLKAADPAWGMKSVHQSFSSGESVVSYFNDLYKKGLPIRLLVTDTEFKTTLSICSRNGNTLSQAYRHMFNGDPMEVRTKLDVMYAPKSCGTLIGLITNGELQETLKAVEIESGFVNRFLLFLVHRVKKIARSKRKLTPEEAKERDAIVVELKSVLLWIDDHKNDVHFEEGEDAVGLSLDWDEDAGLLWDAFYDGLGDDDPEYLNRAEVFVLRLTMIYALLDKSVTMKTPHIKAALAVWAYTSRSGELLLGIAPSPDVERLMNKAIATGQLMRGGILSFFSRNKGAEEIDWLIEEAAKASQGKLVVIVGKDKAGNEQPKGLARPAVAVELLADSNKAKAA